MKICRFLCGLMMMVVTCSVMKGQTISTSQVSGVITDQSGAVVAGADVELTQTDMADVHKAKTNGSGAYIITDLQGGPYRFQVSAPGFSTYVQTGITLEVGTNPAINAKLAVGSVTEQVMVESNALMVETVSTGVGSVVDEKQIVELPLNGRDPTQLIALAGATTTAPSGDLNSNKNFPTITIAVAGGLPNGVAYVLDGGSHNDPFNNLNMPLPFPDALQEFKVETSSLPAQYGDHASAAVNSVTRSGGNKFHGDAFEFLRNYAANAAPFFNYNTATGLKPRDSLKRNQFGGVLGGPILRDKLFFFMGYEETISHSAPSDSSTQVMTPAMLAGDFSQITAPVTQGGCQTQQIFLAAPFTSVKNADGTYTQKINPSLFSSQALAALKSIPIATPAVDVSGTKTVTIGSTSYTLPVGCGYIQTMVPAISGAREPLGRLDYTINDKHRVFARYYQAIYNQPIPATPGNALNQNGVAQYNSDLSIVLGDTYTFTPNLTNAVHLTAKRIVNKRVVDPYFDPSTLGIASFNSIPGYVAMSVTGGFGLGGGTTNPGYFNSTSEQFTDDVSYVHGNHQIAAGVDYIYALMDTVNNRPANGIYAFTGGTLSYTNTTSACATAVAAGTANGLVCTPSTIGYADFITGNLDTFSQGDPDLENDGQTYMAFYAQDAWKPTRRVTVNYGMRWEPYLPEHNSNDHVENFNMANFLAGVKSSVYTNAPAGMTFDGDPGFPSNHYTYGNKNLFEPRLGIIVDPTGDGKMSIRAGYGLFFDSPQMFFNTRYSNSPPYGNTITPAANSSGSPYSFANPWATYPGGDPFPALLSAPKTSPFATGGVYVNSPLHPKEMYLQQWNVAVQRQVGTWLFGATYLGNTTKHLTTSYEANPGVFIPGVSTGVAGSCGSVMTTTATGLPKSGTACSNTSNLTFRRLLYQTNPAQGIYYSTIGTLDDGGIANYNGMLVSVRRQTAKFNVSANYTYAHCLSEQETTELTGPSYAQPPSYNPLGRAAGYSNCDSQRRHVVNVPLILHSPKFQEHYLNSVAGGWQISTIFTATSGSYGSIGLASTSSQSGTGNELAISSGASPYTNARTRFGAGNYLTPTPFSPPAQGTYSPTKPLTILGPPSYELDMTLARTFNVPRFEHHQFQFRVEAFNVTNEAIFSGAATGSISTAGVFSGNAGSFTATGSPRIMQAAVKYIF